MATDILIRSADFAGSRVTVNGRTYPILKDQRYAAPDEVLAALTSARIPWAPYGVRPIPPGSILLPASYHGPRVVMVNGEAFLMPKGVVFEPPAYVMEALRNSGVAYARAPKALTPRPPTILNAAASTAGWSSTSAAVLSNKATAVPHPSGRTSTLNIKTLAGDSFAGARTTAIPAGLRLADMAMIDLWAYWDGSNGSISIRFTSDNFASNGKTFDFAWPGQLHKGWNLLRVAPDDDGSTSPSNATWTVAGGFLDTDVINGIEVRVSTNQAADTEIGVADIGFHRAAPTKGAFILGFGEFGQDSVVNDALPILNAAGIRAYWNGDTDLIQNAGNAQTLARRWYGAGMELGTQGFNHPDYTANPTALGPDYDAAKAIHLGLGLPRGIDYFTYPLSANDDATDAQLAGRVRFAKSGWNWRIRPNQYNAGPKLIGTGAVALGQKTRTQMLKEVDAAIKYGHTNVGYTHGLVAGGDGVSKPGDQNYTYANDYKALVAYLVEKRDAGLIDILSPGQFMAMWDEVFGS